MTVLQQDRNKIILKKKKVSKIWSQFSNQENTIMSKFLAAKLKHSQNPLLHLFYSKRVIFLQQTLVMLKKRRSCYFIIGWYCPVRNTRVRITVTWRIFKKSLTGHGKSTVTMDPYFNPNNYRLIWRIRLIFTLIIRLWKVLGSTH